MTACATASLHSTINMHQINTK